MVPRPGNAATAKKRRSHKKSREGCVECKRRHIRCDERHPTCVNCELIDRVCSFPPLNREMGMQRQKQHSSRNELRLGRAVAFSSEAETGNNSSSSTKLADAIGSKEAEMSTLASKLSPASTAKSHDHALRRDRLSRQSRSSISPAKYASPGSSTNEPHAAVHSCQLPSPASPVLLRSARITSTETCPGLQSAQNATMPTEATYTPQHMILLHHAREVPNLTAHGRSIVDIAIQHAVASPYLLDEVLAYTAMYMAHMYPSSAEHLRYIATELQSRGLVSFRHLTKLVPQNDKPSAVPRFLFASLLGHHALVDALSFCGNDLHFFIERFVEGLNLNRGIMFVIPPAQDFLSDSEMGPFLQVVTGAARKITTLGTDCDPLTRVMEKSDLGETSLEVCRKTITSLQFSFDLCRHLDPADYPQSVSAFIVKVEPGFADLLRKHVSEAIIILAYFGVLLHRCRHFWDFGGAGAALIHNIADFLSVYWHESLVWPLHVLESELIETPFEMEV